MTMKEINIAVRDELLKLAGIGMSMSEMARKIGFSRQQISKWIQLKGNVRRMSAGIIADRLGMEIKFNDDMTECEFSAKEYEENMEYKGKSHLDDYIIMLKSQIEKLETDLSKALDTKVSTKPATHFRLTGDLCLQTESNKQCSVTNLRCVGDTSMTGFLPQEIEVLSVENISERIDDEIRDSTQGLVSLIESGSFAKSSAETRFKVVGGFMGKDNIMKPYLIYLYINHVEDNCVAFESWWQYINGEGSA